MPAPLLLVIVGKGDALLYELDLTAADGIRQMDIASTAAEQFECFAALETLETITWIQPQMFCRVVDRFGLALVSGFVMANHTKFLLLHGPGRSEDALRLFFQDLMEAVTRIQLNPFHDYNGLLYSEAFDQKVRQLASKHMAL